MKKTLIALAVGAAFVAPAAHADVTLSGSINMGVAYAKSGDSSAGVTNDIVTAPAVAVGGISKTGVTTTYSNITIGSMEDLGGGLKLDFAAQMDWGGMNTAGAGLSNRNSHIGLVGDTWGGVWIGTNENIYERYLYSVDPIDGAMGIGGNLTILGNPGIAAFDCPAGSGGRVFSVGNDCGAGFYRRTDHTVWYDSPNWGGFTFGAFSTLTAFKSTTTGLNPRLWGVGAKYVGPSIPIQVWGAYEQHKDVSAPQTAAFLGTAVSSSSDRGYQFGVGYTLGDIFIYGNYEQLKYQSDTTFGTFEYKRNAWSIGGKWNLPTGYVGAQYIQAQDGKCTIPGAACDAHDSGARLISLGYFHTMSKQTQVYVAAAFLNNKDLAQYSNPDALGNPNDNVGVDTTSVTVGIKHSF